MDGRIGPILGAHDQPMLHRVEVAIVYMRNKVRVIADRVLPETPLPESLFALAPLALVRASVRRTMARKQGFDLFPPYREITVAGRQGPDRMNMIRKNDHRVAVQRVLGHDRSIDGPQKVYFMGQGRRRSVDKRDGEEVGPAGDVEASIPWHEPIVPYQG